MNQKHHDAAYYDNHIRLRPGEANGNAAFRRRLAIRTHQEVAEILDVTRAAVQKCERRALAKIRKQLKPFREGMI